MSLLIVDDDLSICDLLVRYFTRRGFDVICANTLTEGMRRLPEDPCGVLLDLSLPDGSGLELLRHVHAAGLRTPVAVVTGMGGAEVADAALMRPSALFTKPVDLSELLSWVRTVCPGG